MTVAFIAAVILLAITLLIRVVIPSVFREQLRRGEDLTGITIVARVNAVLLILSLLFVLGFLAYKIAG